MLKKYDMDVDFTDKYTYTPVGCKECNNTGYYDRIGMFEILTMTDEVKDLIVRGESNMAIREVAIKQGYRPLVVDGIRKSS